MNVRLRAAALAGLVFFALPLLAGALEIRPLPVDSGPERDALSLQYLRQRHNIAAEAPVITPRLIVIHWTAFPTLAESYACFRPVHLPAGRPDIASGGTLNVTAHFLVDRDGSVYQLLPDTTFARHVIGLNHCAIGIENVGSDRHPLTAAQLQANAALVRHLLDRHPAIDGLIGHHEYRRLEDTPLFRETDPAYRTDKIDPGPDFMARLRTELAPLYAAGRVRQ